MQTESANHAESTGDAQEKLTHSYELGFAPNLELTFVDQVERILSSWKVNNLADARGAVS
jgi:hypothetical protein